MMDNLGCFALMLGGESQAVCMSSAISSEEVVIVSSRWPQKVEVFGVAWLWRNSAKSSCVLTRGTPSHAPRSRPALMKSISIPTLSPAMTRKRGSEAIAAVTGVRESGESLRSSADYVARDVYGDPRGRKCGAGPGATNPRWPTRAEGEKRFRSATRNP
jgi:hypothetical protein